jgi:hypothetical protein
MEENQHAISEQTMVTLPFLDDEVPALLMADGRLYIPVYAVCHALGIRAAMHIRRWRRLVVWITARKLPLHTVKRGKRLVWCLLISEVPFLYGLFNWQRVSSDRRLQLLHATQEQVKLSYQVYQNLQQQYKSIRQALFTFLTRFADIDELLQQYTEILSPTLNEEASLVLASLISSGRSLFQNAASHARNMLYDQGKLQIIDAVKIDAHNKVMDTFSMPLLPIVPHEDSELFFVLMGQLTTWRQELQAFWSMQRG